MKRWRIEDDDGQWKNRRPDGKGAGGWETAANSASSELREVWQRKKLE